MVFNAYPSLPRLPDCLSVLQPLSVKQKNARHRFLPGIQPLQRFEVYGYNISDSEEISISMAGTGSARYPTQREKQSIIEPSMPRVVVRQQLQRSMQKRQRISTKGHSQLIFWIILFLRYTPTLAPVTMLSRMSSILRIYLQPC